MFLISCLCICIVVNRAKSLNTKYNEDTNKENWVQNLKMSLGRLVQFGRSLEGPTTKSNSSKTSTRTSESAKGGQDQDTDSSKSEDDNTRTSIIDSSENVNFNLRHAPEKDPDGIETIQTLNKLMSPFFAIVLKDCLDQMNLVAIMNRLPYTDVNLKYEPLYSKYQNATTFDDDLLYNELWQVNFKKFKKDVWFLVKVIKLTLEGLTKDGNFDSLADTIANYNMSVDETLTLLTSKQFNQKELEKLRLMEEGEKTQLYDEITELTTNIYKIKQELSDLFEESKIKHHLITNYETSRQEMNGLVLTTSEHRFKNTIEKCKIQTEREDLIHEEINFFLEETNEEYKEDILRWMEKYDNDFDDLEISINRVKINTEKLHEDYNNLKDEYETRVIQIQEYLEHKRLKQIEAAELEAKNYAATRIQAWWRGTMYRRHLGPWRKKQKGKGKKDSAKSKKKK